MVKFRISCSFDWINEWIKVFPFQNKTYVEGIGFI